MKLGSLPTGWVKLWHWQGHFDRTTFPWMSGAGQHAGVWRNPFSSVVGALLLLAWRAGWLGTSNQGGQELALMRLVSARRQPYFILEATSLQLRRMSSLHLTAAVIPVY